MGIDAPEEQAKVTLEQIKNQITLGELEIKRLKGLKAGEEYALAELVKSKSDHQESIVSAQKQLQSHNADIKKLQGEIDTLSNMLKSGKEELERYEAEKAEAIRIVKESNATFQSNQEKITKEKEELAKTKADIEKREKILIEREKSFESNLSKLNEIIDELREV